MDDMDDMVDCCRGWLLFVVVVGIGEERYHSLSSTTTGPAYALASLPFLGLLPPVSTTTKKKQQQQQQQQQEQCVTDRQTDRQTDCW
jgi:hypothetical protein